MQNAAKISSTNFRVTSVLSFAQARYSLYNNLVHKVVHTRWERSANKSCFPVKVALSLKILLSQTKELLKLCK